MSSQLTAPAPVSRRRRAGFSFERSARCLAAQRTPLPHISALLPSALWTIKRAWAEAEGSRTNTPSAPMPRRRSQSCLAVAASISRPLSRRSKRTKSFPRPWYLNAVSRSPGVIGLALIQQTAHGRAIASALFGVRFAGLRRPGLGPSKELGLEGGELRRRPLVNLLHLQGGAGQRAAEGGELGVLGGKPAVKYLQLALPVRHGGGQLPLPLPPSPPQR